MAARAQHLVRTPCLCMNGVARASQKGRPSSGPSIGRFASPLPLILFTLKTKKTKTPLTNEDGSPRELCVLRAERLHAAAGRGSS
ncbi:hypothetical protein OAO87_00490 [bacterium]|nr:hypothetical protein [bacterium]